MDELADKTEADIIAATRDLEAEVRKMKQQITRVTQETKLLDVRIKEN